jgi:hypothetical protein
LLDLTKLPPIKFSTTSGFGVSLKLISILLLECNTKRKRLTIAEGHPKSRSNTRTTKISPRQGDVILVCQIVCFSAQQPTFKREGISNVVLIFKAKKISPSK